MFDSGMMRERERRLGGGDGDLGAAFAACWLAKSVRIVSSVCWSSASSGEVCASMVSVSLA